MLKGGLSLNFFLSLIFIIALISVPSLSRKIALFFSKLKVSNYHFVLFIWSNGCETIKCHIRTCMDSDMGVLKKSFLVLKISE